MNDMVYSSFLTYCHNYFILFYLFKLLLDLKMIDLKNNFLQVATYVTKGVI